MSPAERIRIIAERIRSAPTAESVQWDLDELERVAADLDREAQAARDEAAARDQRETMLAGVPG